MNKAKKNLITLLIAIASVLLALMIAVTCVMYAFSSYMDQYLGRGTRVVTDTGEGIPQEKLKDIWERYYKVDKEHKRAQMGSGLGLSIVKNILDMHGGTYGVTSTLGQGSTFWFELPVARQSPEGLPGPQG